ncbi:MAG: DUF2341 domain-containing protein, partial [Thermodesulfobacteriota bacterium]|nr:DUF2341 domain-containing protein [Thermodesulfobacteriota bacterium]
MERARTKLHFERWIAVFLFLALIFGLNSQVRAIAGEEMVEQRTLTTKTFDNGDGTFTFESHAGHIHYLDKATGALKECDTSLIDVGDRWVQTKASYECELPKYANGDFSFTDLYDGKDQTVVMRPLAKHVPGEIDNSDGWINKRVLYRNAYGPGLHLRVTAGNEGLFKEVIIENKPYPLRDLSFGFEINPPSEQYAYVFDGKEGNTPSPVLLANLDVTGKQQVLMGQNAMAENAAFTRIKQIRIWDSEGEVMAGRIQFYHEGDKLCFRKIVPKEFLATAAYPVYTDDTVTYYVGAGDGYVQKGNVTNWDTTHNATVGQLADSVDNKSFFCRTGMKPNGGKYIVTRAFFPFDTSGLPDTAVISDATLSLYVTAKQSGDNDSEDFLVVVQTTQASTSSLSTADFVDCGSVHSPIEGSNRVDIGNITINQYNSWSLNATGLGWISTTGWTKLGMREGHDVLDHAYIGAADTKNRINGYWSEQSGTTYDPKLSLTYAIGITVSGRVFKADGSSYGDSRPIALRVDGGGTYSANTDTYGFYSIAGVDGVSPGAVITAWVDDYSAIKGTTVTVANDSTSNISGLDIHGSRIIVRSEGAMAVTNADLAVYNNDDDADIHFASDGATLTVDNDHDLRIWTGDTFSPGGAVTTSSGGPHGNIQIDDNATFIAGGVVSCGASWTAGTGSTFTHNDNTVTFTATSTGQTITTNGQSFFDVAFDGTGGGWAFQDAATVTNDLTITNGTVSSSHDLNVRGGNVTGNGTLDWTGGTFTVDGAGFFGGDTDWTFYQLTFGDGSGTETTTSTGSGAIIVSDVLTIASEHTLNAGDRTWKIGDVSGSGTPLVVNGALDPSSSTFSFATDQDTNITAATYYNLELLRGPYWRSGYTMQEITIDSTKIDEDLTDFPVLVKLSSANFDFSKANPDGHDIRFTADDGLTLLEYEREGHDSGNEKAEYWVRIPLISSSTDTDFYVFYRTTDTDDGADPTNVWDDSFKMVQHLEETPANGVAGHVDSTSNDNNGTPYAFDDLPGSTTDGTGNIDGADEFDGTDDYVNVGNVKTPEFAN